MYNNKTISTMRKNEIIKNLNLYKKIKKKLN